MIGPPPLPSDDNISNNNNDDDTNNINDENNNSNIENNNNSINDASSLDLSLSKLSDFGSAMPTSPSLTSLPTIGIFIYLYLSIYY